MENKAISLRSKGWETVYISVRLKGAASNIPLDLAGKVKLNLSLLSGLILIFKILREIKNEKPNLVQFSGIWTYLMFPFLSVFLRSNNIAISLDYQGALEELIEFDSGLVGLLKRFLYQILKIFEKNLYLSSDVIEVVSHNCKLHLNEIYGKTSAKFAIVPCLILRPFTEEVYLRHREVWRNVLGITASEVALVYAGGTSKWQCIEEVAYFFNSLTVKCYIFTSAQNFDSIAPFVHNNVKLLELKPDELREALCAFDYGLLPRNKNKTNLVAFPNKFSEYYNARLTVLIKSDAIGFFDSFRLVCRKIDFREDILPVKAPFSIFDPKYIALSEPIEHLVSNYLMVIK